MSEIKLGIIGGGQLGSMLSNAAQKLNVKTVIYCDDLDAPAKNFCDEFIFGKYDEKEKINEFIEKQNEETRKAQGNEQMGDERTIHRPNVNPNNVYNF